MVNFLEKIGLRKNEGEIQRQKEIQEMKKYLQDTAAQYKMNQYRLQSMPEAFLGSGHQEDTKDIGAVQYSLENLRKIILETAQKLGKDGNALIAEIDEDVRRSQETKKAA